MAAALGVGSSDIKKARVTEINSSKDAPLMPKASGKARQYAGAVKEEEACSACYAALIRALSRMDRSEINKLKGPVCIGQGFQGKTGKLGVGRCTKDFAVSVPGCPPGAGDIMGVLRRQGL
jgi:hypothetical protein